MAAANYTYASASSSRQNRGLSQRLLLKPRSLRIIDLNFFLCAVIGSTGKEYSVAVNNGWTTCSCPDFEQNDGAVTCKHIYFFLSRVLHTPEAIWRRGNDFSDAQMQEISGRVHRVLEQVFECEVGETLHATHRKKIPAEQSECCICLEEFRGNGEGSGDSIVYCQKQCGYNFHTECIARCRPTTRCPMCRTELLS